MAKRVLITAGPTHEPIDAVRYLANRSGGAMGLALAAAARDAGHQVTLLLGPTPRTPPADVSVERYESSADLRDLLDAHFPRCDLLIMAAAVADYRPATRREGKLERSGERLLLELEPTEDLVARCAAGKGAEQRIIGFALEEPARLADRAQAKLRRKGLDAIVANPLRTMGSSDVEATVYTADGGVHEPGPMSKVVFANWLIAWANV